MTRAPGLVFGGIEGVGSRFHVFRFRTHFRRYRGRRVPFSCFALPDSFSAVWRASGPIIMFFVSVLVFVGTEGLGSRFHVLRSQTRFRRYRGRRHPFFMFFALPDLFSAVSRASGPVFMFCAPELDFGDFEDVRSRFHFVRSRTRFRRSHFSCFSRPYTFSSVPRASGRVFKFCAPGLDFGGTEGVGYCFHVLRSRTRFLRYRRRRLPFSCFTRPD
jgi:hypothetical protein